ncbi:zinc metalloproteinase nas-6-like isoform X1 [Montipora foliosa]|uniref:zinc metalloproteinase nas-6-like isoform X1 n=1 Tax=Montipora foliosa TaxID=591990 RepID=UPI0035F1A8A2
MLTLDNLQRNSKQNSLEVKVVLFLLTCKLQSRINSHCSGDSLRKHATKSLCRSTSGKVTSASVLVSRDQYGTKFTAKNVSRNRRKRNFIPNKRYWWREKTVPFMLDKSVGVTGRKAFNAAIADFKKKTCIRFIKHTNEEDYIWVHRGSGCFSITGKSGGKQNLSLGKGCGKKGVVIHELLHALGMMHEHCRADRDQFIRINFDNIKPKARIEYQKWNGYTIDEPYDYGSVMHYGSYFFSLDRHRPIIVKLMPGGPQIGQRKGFSDLDLRKINKLYKCKNYVRLRPAPRRPIVKIVSGNCSFERGFCNWKNWRNKMEDQFDWKIRNMVDEPHFQSSLKQPSGNFVFFKRPQSRAEYMSSGVLYSGFFIGSCCLRFYYHMNTGGYLRVFINENESQRKNPFVLIWQKVGRQGNMWRKMEKHITGIRKPYKIYIEGIKTPQLTGIVAVDHVCVIQGATCMDT